MPGCNEAGVFEDANSKLDGQFEERKGPFWLWAKVRGFLTDRFHDHVLNIEISIRPHAYGQRLQPRKVMDGSQKGSGRFCQRRTTDQTELELIVPCLVSRQHGAERSPGLENTIRCQLGIALHDLGHGPMAAAPGLIDEQTVATVARRRSNGHAYGPQ